MKETDQKFNMSFDIRAKYYNIYRKADMRLTREIIKLTGAKSDSLILDVGAGTGNYSISLINMGYNVIALEPEKGMIEQCFDKRVNWICSSVYKIPLANNSVDTAIIVNAIHHFKDLEMAFLELKRVVGKGTIIIFTFDPDIACKQWIFEYWPSLVKYEHSNYLPINKLKYQILNAVGGNLEEYIYKLPSDFEDVFSAALWKRPSLLLESSEIKYAMSIFNSLDDTSFNCGLSKLRQDFISRKWEKKNQELLYVYEWDVGCRLLKLEIF